MCLYVATVQKDEQARSTDKVLINQTTNLHLYSKRHNRANGRGKRKDERLWLENEKMIKRKRRKIEPAGGSDYMTGSEGEL